MIIKVLGSGCTNCQNLEKATREALAGLGLEASIEHVTDPADIASYGVMRTPALVIDGNVVASGKIPSAAEIAVLITTAAAKA